MIIAALATISFTGLVYAITSTAALPDVHVSYGSNACVKVVNYAEGDNYSCENMPAKFHHVWVQ